MEVGEPYLSVVVTSRNDNHGGSLLRRMQTFINALVAQCNRHQLPTELIIVEWNPPADRPPLAEALQWPAERTYCPVRIIEVPAELHNRLAHAASLPLFQMIAKNVGIRRARARYILATNIDIIFNDELMAWLSSRPLQPNRMYRIDRYDVMTDVPVDAPIDEQLRYCETHPLRINAREGTFPQTPTGLRALWQDDVAPQGSGISFDDGWFAVEHRDGEAFRWGGERARFVFENPPPDHFLALDIEAGPSLRHQTVDLHFEDETGQVVARGSLSGREQLYVRFPLDARPVQSFTLVTPGRTMQQAHDPRLLHVGLLRCAWVPGPLPWNVVPVGEGVATAEPLSYRQRFPALGEGISLARGWYEVEEAEGESYRWARDKAHLVVCSPGPNRVLRLDLESGPALDHEPFELQIQNARGEILTRGRICNRQIVDLTLAMPAGEPCALTLMVRGGSRVTVAHEPRMLCFRLFSARWVEVPPNNLSGPRFQTRIDWRRTVRRLLQAPRKKLTRLATQLVGVVQGANGASGLAALPQTSAPEEILGPVLLHNNACGDFTLLARENWEAVLGNPEMEIYSFNLDSLFCFQAYHAGAEEVIIPPPCKIYHIEHSAGSGWTPEGAGELMKRLQAKNIPVLSYEETLAYAIQMRRQKRPLLFNTANWGLANEPLRETVI